LKEISELRTKMWVFDRAPITEEAKKIIDQLFVSLHLHKTKSKTLPLKQYIKAKAMFSRLLSSLIERTRLNQNQIIYRSLSKDTFSIEIDGVSYSFFIKAINALKSKQYITHEPGGMYPIKDFPDEIGGIEPIKEWHSTKASQFSVTTKFIKLCGNKYGLGKKKIERHYEQLEPASYIDVRYPSKRYGRIKQRGRRVSRHLYHRHSSFAQATKEMQTINRYLFKQDIQGARFTGLKRTFNNYTDESYSWDKGGRLSGIGSEHYQALDSEARQRITINREATVEIDITASHFNILHRIVGEQLPNQVDLYGQIPKLDRKVVKSWMTITLSNSKPCMRWPPKTLKKLKEKGLWEKGLTASKVGEAALRVYPWLAELSFEAHGWPVLQYIESEVIKNTLLKLIDKDIPALPIHDSIIVPKSRKQEAERVLFVLFSKG
jgi:hypothetical protein